jgi:predicted amidohydrolase YtcJ
MINQTFTDIILTNANVITLDPGQPHAKLISIANGKILGVGDENELARLKSDNHKVIDCHGKTIVPGFIDAHMHLSSLAESLVTINLGTHKGIRSISDIQDKIQQLAQNRLPGEWIRCGGYDEFSLKEKRHPTRWDLDIASSVHPIKLTHRSGHAHVLNSLALRMTGILRETPDPEGSLIDRDITTGEPTGLLYGMSELLSRSIPPLGTKQLDQGIELANRKLLSWGITSIQDASFRNDASSWKKFQRWKDQGYLKPRISMVFGVRAFDEYRKENLSSYIKTQQLSISGVKIIMDETTGKLNPGHDKLIKLVAKIHQSGFQALIHAIEEPSIEAAYTAIAYALQRSPRSDHRHRIEHCSVCPPHLARRLASVGIMVVSQPSFIYYSGDRYLKTVLRSQLKHLYPFSSLLKNNVSLAGSSDCPIVPPNPLIGIYSAVSRRSETGRTVLAYEGITPLDALHMYTDYAARATFEENIKGSIMPGKLADLAVLSDDPTKCPTEEIKNIQVEMTVLNGEVVWDKWGLTNNTALNIRG